MYSWHDTMLHDIMCHSIYWNLCCCCERPTWARGSQPTAAWWHPAQTTRRCRSHGEQKPGHRQSSLLLGASFWSTQCLVHSAAQRKNKLVRCITVNGIYSRCYFVLTMFKSTLVVTSTRWQLPDCKSNNYLNLNRSQSGKQNLYSFCRLSLVVNIIYFNINHISSWLVTRRWLNKWLKSLSTLHKLEKTGPSETFHVCH